MAISESTSAVQHANTIMISELRERMKLKAVLPLLPPEKATGHTFEKDTVTNKGLVRTDSAVGGLASVKAEDLLNATGTGEGGEIIQESKGLEGMIPAGVGMAGSGYCDGWLKLV